MTGEIATYLKYALLQMAAEAVDLDAVLAGTKSLANALIKGNDRNSKFTTAQAADFATEYEVVAHQSNTPTGFSGTLFREKATGELIMSFRSTEFLDDAVRDSQATNALEIKKNGWAFGQIADMEKWLSELRTAGKIDAKESLSVTGYSLGGHLATAFNLLHKNDVTPLGTPLISATYTFNGAGVGQYNTGSLRNVIDTFSALRQATSSAGSGLTDPAALSLDAEFRARIKSGSLPTP